MFYVGIITEYYKLKVIVNTDDIFLFRYVHRLTFCDK